MISTFRFLNLRALFVGMNYAVSFDGDRKKNFFGICAGLEGEVIVEVANALEDKGLSLDSVGFTTARWTRFKNSYLRPDYIAWIERSIGQMEKNPRKPSVAGYQTKHVGEHTFGSCLQAVNFRLYPTPHIYLFSRACQIDKAGLCDIILLNATAREIEKRTGIKQIGATWHINLLFISAFCQLYFLRRWDYIKIPLDDQSRKVLADHCLGPRVEHFLEEYFVKKNWGKYGPVKRVMRRMERLQDGRVWTYKTSKIKDLHL